MNIAFVIWMLGYPLISALAEYIVDENGRKNGKVREYARSTIALAALFEFLLWVTVGIILYQ